MTELNTPAESTPDLTIEQHTKDFMEAVHNQDKEAMIALPKRLAKADRQEGLAKVIEAFKEDTELAAANEGILKVLEAAHKINTMMEEVEETEEAVVAEPVKEEAEDTSLSGEVEELPAA